MKLARLAEAVGMDAGARGEETVTGFAIDHRKVAPGTVFDFGPDGTQFAEPVTLTLSYDPSEL